MSWLADTEVVERIERLEVPFNRHGIDPFGISKAELARWLGLSAWFYRNYFKVSVSGLDNVLPRGRAMLVGNHSGGVALDGAMVVASLFLELDPPRLVQGMAEKFLGRLPFVSHWLARTGQFIGLPEHAVQLLEAERLLLVFPEGARGTAKLYGERNTLVDFGTGFIRLALETKTPIVPFAFLGGGEAIPTVVNLYRLGELFGMPYVPVTPYLLPIPRPVPLEIYYSEPMMFEGKGDEEDVVILRYVSQVRARIAELVDQGERIRRGRDTQVMG
jgi:1-acyl-sn-glycerol-3-phosphate acyltransferase